MNNFLKWVEKINNRLVGDGPNAVQIVSELKPLNFDGMGLDEKWQEVFRLIHQAGGHKSKGILDLDSASRRKIFFNGYAMLFGIFYYIKLGMVKRGLMLLLASVVVGIFLLLFVWMFITLNFMLGWFSMTIVFAFLCNRDYYNHKVNGVDEFSLR